MMLWIAAQKNPINLFFKLPTDWFCARRMTIYLSRNFRRMGMGYHVNDSW